MRSESGGRTRGASDSARRWFHRHGQNERGLALGRKNYLFVGDVEAGASIAGLYTLVATCEARGINPFAYLSDVIPRVQDHPKRRLDELLPGPWVRARADT